MTKKNPLKVKRAKKREVKPKFTVLDYTRLKIQLQELRSNRRLWLPLLLAFSVLMLYLYLCLSYNLQFYTEDEKYVQIDMTNLASLSQWKMGNYRLSSAFGAFIYYPLLTCLEFCDTLLSRECLRVHLVQNRFRICHQF